MWLILLLIRNLSLQEQEDGIQNIEERSSRRHLFLTTFHFIDNFQDKRFVSDCFEGIGIKIRECFERWSRNRRGGSFRVHSG